MKLQTLVIVAILLASCGSQALSIKNKKDHSRIVQRYFKEVKKFKRKVCSYKELHDYEKLLKTYQGRGHYIPLVNDKVDREAILANIGLIKNKKRWLEQIYSKLKKVKSLPQYSRDVRDLKNRIDENLELKYRYEVKNVRTENLIKKVRDNAKELKRSFRKIEEKAFYLFNFGYPVDHLTHRVEYAKYKELEGEVNKKKANKIFMKRKIYEDGASHPQSSRTDRFVRTALDTIKLSLLKTETFLDEDLRYDLEWIIEKLSDNEKRNKNYFLVRIKNWKERVEDALSFYNDLTVQTEGEKERKFASVQYQATQNIKKFITKKHGEVYRYWMKKKPALRKLFVFDTILFNEVGPVDPEGLERSEIIKVVINRHDHPFYGSLDEKQDLYRELKKDVSIEKYPWLNTLFREGEFSFTYFFIPAVTNVFCPPLTKWGKSLRKDNLHRSLAALAKKPQQGADQPMRYFSRASMVGRINMSTVWDTHEALPEGLGRELREGLGPLNSLLSRGRFRYFYSFNRNDEHYQVYELDAKKYVVSNTGGKRRFYAYRDPNLFRFFKELVPSGH